MSHDLYRDTVRYVVPGIRIVKQPDEARAGQKVLDRAVETAAADFGPQLAAAFALGSLAHGGFAPLVSDVDLMLVLDVVDRDTPARVDELRRRVRGSEQTDLADRLSVFWADWAGVQTGVGRHGRLPEVDRLDLLEAGRLLHGVDRRSGSVPPQAAVITRQTAEFALQKFDDTYLAGLDDTAQLVDAGARPTTKAVLFPVRFLYTLHTGRIGRNEDAAGWFPVHYPHGELITAAMSWREHGVTDPTSAQGLLERHLVPIYAIFAGEYATALSRLGHPSLAAKLTRWAEWFDRRPQA